MKSSFSLSICLSAVINTVPSTMPTYENAADHIRICKAIVDSKNSSLNIRFTMGLANNVTVRAIGSAI